MKKYEVMFIVRPDLESEKVAELVKHLKEIFTNRQGSILEEKDYGVKELAYEINKFTKGAYYWFLAETNSEAVNEFERVARINESILRSIVVGA